VRVIFKLPPMYGDHPHPLAYVEWFTAFANPDADSGLYKIRPSTRMGQRRASIIRVDELLRPCHLVGKVSGGTINDRWTSHNVLDKADTFFLNNFITLDFWSYFCLPPMVRTRQ
jgi:hypothetical protein